MGWEDDEETIAGLNMSAIASSGYPILCYATARLCSDRMAHEKEGDERRIAQLNSYLCCSVM